MDSDEEANAAFEAAEWKPNDGKGRRLSADYIMRQDPDARRAYMEMRNNRGLSHEEAELRIERCADANFRAAILHEGDPSELDRRPDMWVELARGFTVEQIFPNIELLGMVRRDGPLQ
jgi:hypothetical protein